jgi:hypothetical protein
MMGPASRRVAFAAAFALSAIAGCASPADDGEDDVAQGAAQAASTTDGFVYFHGMSHLGFARDALRTGLGNQTFLAPTLSDAQIQDAVAESVVDFLGARHEAVAAGYSLGRIPVLRLMQSSAGGMTRAILVDPTYDGSHALGFGVGGGIARTWLDADQGRSLLLVYGDVTRSLGGEKSYTTALAGHPRASLCYVRGDHERFRQPDMVAALVAKDCGDLSVRLSTP